MKTRFLFFLFFIGFYAHSQVSIVKDRVGVHPIELYKTTNDFLEKKVFSTEKIGVLNLKIKDFKIEKPFEEVKDTLKLRGDALIIRSFVDRASSEKFPDGERAWALKYNDAFFFNLGYSSDLNSWGSWAKLSVVGKYCLVFVEPNSYLEYLIGNSSAGLGLSGVLTKGSVKWGKSFLDKNNKNMKILFIDTNNQREAALSRYDGSIGNLLTRKNLKKLSEEAKVELDVENASFEDVVSFFNTLNSKSNQ